MAQNDAAGVMPRSIEAAGLAGSVEVDLNLLVSESGEVLRYHVMGNPPRRVIEQVICFSGLPLEEIDLGWRGDRDAERNTAGT
jgi:hypothetical protein